MSHKKQQKGAKMQEIVDTDKERKEFEGLKKMMEKMNGR
tara:strand:- start:155 stop:271 length:117 start_codon:yes stop_codon:yes gene_type:complete